MFQHNQESHCPESKCEEEGCKWAVFKEIRFLLVDGESVIVPEGHSNL